MARDLVRMVEEVDVLFEKFMEEEDPDAVVDGMERLLRRAGGFVEELRARELRVKMVKSGVESDVDILKYLGEDG